jgi:hypothetical protein
MGQGEISLEGTGKRGDWWGWERAERGLIWTRQGGEGIRGTGQGEIRVWTGQGGEVIVRTGLREISLDETG